MRITDRKSVSRYLYVIFTALLFVQCSKDDDFVYPEVLTDFMDVYTNAEAQIDRVQADASEMLYLQNVLSAKGLKADTVYRAVGMYAVPGEEPLTALYSLTLIYAQTPFKLEGELAVKTDPLNIESVYRGGTYLNVVAQPMMQTKPHGFAFVQDSLSLKTDGHAVLHLKLAHNQNGDRESFPRRVYLSVPLKGYGLKTGDSICFRANIYEKGVQMWKVAY